MSLSLSPGAAGRLAADCQFTNTWEVSEACGQPGSQGPVHQSFSATRDGVVSQCGHIGSNIDDQLISVDGKYRHSESDWLVVLVKGDTGVNEDRSVVSNPEKGLFVLGCQSSGDPVAVAGLPDADLVGQVGHAALFDVQRHEQLGGALGDELHEVERGLYGPRDVVDVTVLRTADDLGFGGNV